MANRINIFKHFLLLFVLLFTSLSVLAYEPIEKDKVVEPDSTEKPTHDEHAKGKFNAGELIIGHITDAHDWHIAGEGEHSIALPLPIIIYSKERGLSIFLSNKFEHGHKTYKGYMLEKNHI